MTNEYSPQWFETFLDTIPADWTEFEVEAIMRFLPLPDYTRVVDICCGPGRHAHALVAAGYDVVGVDRDAGAIHSARQQSPSARFEVVDQRELPKLASTFDAAMILWQSFGYFDGPTNGRVLGDIAGLLRPGGRLLLDVYHPGFVSANTGEQRAERAPNCRSILNEIEDGRLVSTITYDDGSTESMDFQLYTPDELTRAAAGHGFSPVAACARWDLDRPPSREDHRYQLVLERDRVL